MVHGCSTLSVESGEHFPVVQNDRFKAPDAPPTSACCPSGFVGKQGSIASECGVSRGPVTGSTTIPLVDPIYDYDRDAGRSITGGYVYRGAAFPTMRGRYFFGDYATRRVWSLQLNVNPTTGEASPSTSADLLEHTADLGGSTVLGGISGFGVDAAGELFIINHSGGTILKVVGAPAAPTNVRITR